MPDTTSRPAGRASALLFVSFGGPEGPDDVLPFLENVTRGRGVPRERLEEVAEQYLQFGGRSPINDLNRALIDALGAELSRRGVDLDLYFGNRNWHPFIADALAEAVADGHHDLLALVTSAYSSYSGCRQYREDIADAVGTVAPDLAVTKLRPFWNHPGFVTANADHVREALARLAAAGHDGARLVFTAHSIPTSMAATSDYELQLRDAVALVVADLERTGDRTAGDADLVFQSRSGPPQVPWLEPDIGDHLAALHRDGVDAVVVVPIGFIADHMEVVYDLDTQAAAVADHLGMAMERAATAGTHPAFVAALADLVEEGLDPARPRRAVGPLGPRVMPCALDCCPAPIRPGTPAR